MKSSNKNIFVTNDYFKKHGVSRQILEYKRRKGKIKSVVEFKGMKLYYMIDADFIIIEYWINNLRRFYQNYKETIKKKEKVQTKIDKLLKKQKKTNLSEDEIEQLEYILPQHKSIDVSTKEFYELKKLINKYDTLKDVDLQYSMKIYDKYEVDKAGRIKSMYTEFLFRLLALIESKLSVDDYIREEKIVGRWRDNYMILEYYCLKNKKSTGVDFLYNYKDELHKKIFGD